MGGTDARFLWGVSKEWGFRGRFFTFFPPFLSLFLFKKNIQEHGRKNWEDAGGPH